MLRTIFTLLESSKAGFGGLSRPSWSLLVGDEGCFTFHGAFRGPRLAAAPVPRAAVTLCSEGLMTAQPFPCICSPFLCPCAGGAHGPGRGHLFLDPASGGALSELCGPAGSLPSRLPWAPSPHPSWLSCGFAEIDLDGFLSHANKHLQFLQVGSEWQWGPSLLILWWGTRVPVRVLTDWGSHSRSSQSWPEMPSQGPPAHRHSGLSTPMGSSACGPHPLLGA